MAERVFIAIAVARPDELEFVPGAIPSAKRLMRWAKSQGYDTTLVDDDDPALPVTCSRLRDIFVEKLGEGGQERLIVAFTGHGLLRDGAQEFWLLNNWRIEATEAVNIVKMRERLATYKPKQLAIISDACRSLVTTKTRYVEGNGVVPIKDYNPAGVQFADLYGTQAAHPAYSEPLGTNEAHCFFSRILTDILMGLVPAAIETDPLLGDIVRNDLLMSTVEAELPRFASRFDRSQEPDLRSSWRLPGNVWCELGPVRNQPADGDDHLPSELPPTPPKRGLGASAPKLRAAWLRSMADDVAMRIGNEGHPTHFESGTGLAVNGSSVEIPVVGANVRSDRPFWFEIDPTQMHGSASFAIKLGTGMWAAGAVVPGFVSTLSVNEDGVSSLITRRSGDDATQTISAIARMLTGQTIDGVQVVYDLLKSDRSPDPILAAFAAYTFMRSGAGDAILRVVERFAHFNEPIPFDLALVARQPLERDQRGWALSLGEVRARIAGSFPWLRQGWSLLEDNHHPEMRRLSSLVEMSDGSGLASAPFTTFRTHAGSLVAELIKTGEL